MDYSYSLAPLEFVFQEQSYSSLYSGRSLAWDHVRGDIDYSCVAIANFCGVIADPCGVAIPEAIGGCDVMTQYGTTMFNNVLCLASRTTNDCATR